MDQCIDATVARALSRRIRMPLPPVIATVRQEVLHA
jgi:hypothetical protein